MIDSVFYVSHQDYTYDSVYHYINGIPFGEKQPWMSEALELEHYQKR